MTYRSKIETRAREAAAFARDGGRDRRRFSPGGVGTRNARRNQRSVFSRSAICRSSTQRSARNCGSSCSSTRSSARRTSVCRSEASGSVGGPSRFASLSLCIGAATANTAAFVSELDQTALRDGPILHVGATGLRLKHPLRMPSRHTPHPTARSGIAASVLNGKIIVVGGEAPSVNQMEAYAPPSDTWSEYTPMPTARHGLGSAVVAGKMYVISGGPSPGASFSAANEIFTP